MALKKSGKYLFSLRGVNISKVEQQYGIGIMDTEEVEHGQIPMHSTDINDLVTVKRTPDIISFLDESKRLRKCTVSMVDFRTGEEIKQGKESDCRCFWDHHDIPQDIQAIGCPINYVPPKITKKYFSEIGQDNYSISEQVTIKKANDVKTRGNTRLSVNIQNYYETDGVFCSFNCCMKYIDANRHNPIYNNSENLLLMMYNTLHTNSTEEIAMAPDIRKLIGYGGNMTIDQYRESFNSIEYKYYGILKCVPVGHIYEKRIKF